MALTAAEQAELEQLEQEAAGGAPQGLTPDEQKELAQLELMSQQEKPGVVTSAIRKLASGASAGFSDELAGGFEAAGQAAGLTGFGGPIKDIKYTGNPTLDLKTLKEAYERGKQKERALLKLDEVTNPGVSKTMDIAGAVVSPINKIGKGLSLAKQSAIIGGMTGLGNSEADTIAGNLEDTAMGGAVGGVLGKGIDKLAPAVTKYITDPIANKSKELANWMAAKAVGAERGTLKSLGAEKVQDIGEYALTNKLLSPLANTDDLIARNQAVKQKAADARTAIYKEIDDVSGSTFNPLETAVDIEKKAGGFWRSPINKSETNQLENTLESVTMRGDKNISLNEAQKLKEELGKVANWRNTLNPTDKEKMAREAYGVVNEAIDKAATDGAKTLNKEGAEKIIKESNKLYSAGKSADVLLENKLAREQGNKMLGLTDWGLLGGGTAAGLISGGSSILPTLGLLGLKKGAEKYGAQNSALLMNKFGNTVKGIPQAVKNNPAVYPYLMMKLNEEEK
jgi:hypothetical protein